MAYGLLDHRHTPEMEQILGRRSCSRPTWPPWCGASWPPATPAPPTAGRLTTEDAMQLLHDRYDDEPFVVVRDAPPSTKATGGSNAAHVTARVDPRTGLGRRAVGPRQPGEGRGRPGRAVRQRWHSACPRAPGCPWRGSTRERHHARRASWPPDWPAGIKAAGALDLALVATDDGRPVPTAGVFTRTWPRPRPSRSAAAHLAATGGRAAAVLMSGNANAATGDPGRARRRRPLCRLVAEDLGVAAEEVLVCPDRADRHPVSRWT